MGLSGSTVASSLSENTCFPSEKTLIRAEHTITTRHYRTEWAPRPWGSRQVTLTLVPRNEYRGEVRLEAGAPGIRADLADPVLTLGSPARTVLRMRPEGTRSGEYPVTVRAYDHRGRLVRDREYRLTLSSRRPATRYWTRAGVETVRPPVPEVPVVPSRPTPVGDFPRIMLIGDDAWTLPGSYAAGYIHGGFFQTGDPDFWDGWYPGATTWEGAERFIRELEEQHPQFFRPWDEAIA